VGLEYLFTDPPLQEPTFTDLPLQIPPHRQMAKKINNNSVTELKYLKTRKKLHMPIRFQRCFVHLLTDRMISSIIFQRMDLQQQKLFRMYGKRHHS